MAEQNTSNELNDAALKSLAASKKLKSSFSKGKKISKKIGAKNPILMKYICIGLGIIFVLAIIIQGTSTMQMQDTFGISPSVSSFHANKINEDAMNDRKVSQERTASMMETIQEVVSKDHEKVENKIREHCRANNLDVEMSLNSMVDTGVGFADIGYAPVEEPELVEKEKKKETQKVSNEEQKVNNKDQDKSKTKEEEKENDKEKDKIQEESKETEGKVIQNFDLSKLTEANRTTMTYENFFRDTSSPRLGWAKGTFQGKFASMKDKWKVDDYGLLRAINEDEDFLIALGSYFGDTGNRYRITFKNGASYIFLKFDAKADQDTIGGLAHGVDGSVVEFLVDQHGYITNLHPSMKRGNIIKHPLGLFDGGIESIELIEGKVDTSGVMINSTFTPRILAAFSVSYENLYHKKKEKEDKYYDNKNNELKGSIVDELYGTSGLLGSDYFRSTLMASELDASSNTLLKKKLKKYVNKGNSFFDISYQNQTTIVKEKEIIKVPSKDTDKKGEMEEKVIIKEKEVKYCVPTVSAKDINFIAEEVFDIDPEGKYVNADNTTNKDAIDTIADQTYALLYDDSPGGLSDSFLEGDGIFSGKFAPPMKAGTYRITQEFGVPNPGGTTHLGIDMGTGTFGNNQPAVYAVDGGIVVHADDKTDHWSYGNCILIDHGKGFTSRYAHLSEIKVKAGQKVSKGQAIGKTGSTGNSTGPHLHFELRKNGGTVNPRSYIKFR